MDDIKALNEIEADLDNINAVYDEKEAFLDAHFENGSTAQKAIAITLKMEIDTVKHLVKIAKGLCAELKKKEGEQ